MTTTPWFNPEKDGLPIRSGLYQVANKAVVQMSEGKDPFGFVYQWFEAKKASWSPWQKWGFYSKDCVGAWRGLTKTVA